MLLSSPMRERLMLNVVLGRGNAKVKFYDINGNLHDVFLNNALYIPSYNQNIFSVSVAVETWATVIFRICEN